MGGVPDDNPDNMGWLITIYYAHYKINGRTGVDGREGQINELNGFTRRLWVLNSIQCAHTRRTISGGCEGPGQVGYSVVIWVPEYTGAAMRL